MFDACIRTYISLILVWKITINIHECLSNYLSRLHSRTCREHCSIRHKSYGTDSVKGPQQTSIWTYTFMMEIVNRNLFKVSVISIFIPYNNVFYLKTTVITDTLLILTINIPCPKTIDIGSGLIEIKHLYTSWSSMTDDEYCILQFSQLFQLHHNSNYLARPENMWYEFLYQSVTKGKTHYKRDLNCSILVFNDRRCIFCQFFSQGGRFVFNRVGVVCLQTDKTQCLYIHEVMRAFKWSEKLKYRFTGLNAFQLIP